MRKRVGLCLLRLSKFVSMPSALRYAQIAAAASGMPSLLQVIFFLGGQNAGPLF